MLKHIKPRDILEFLLFGLLVLVLIVLAGILESAPLGVTMWIAVIFSAALWIVYIVIVARQRKTEASRPKLKMMQNGRWVDVAPMIESPRRPVQLFDQDEAAITHLDFNQKEQA